MVTNKHVQIALLVLFLVLLLIIVAMMYWQHVTHVSFLHNLLFLLSAAAGNEIKREKSLYL
jgi:lipoprotein signal peptidase